MRCNAFVEAWKNHHRRASMILGLSLLSAPLSYSVYAEDGVSNTMVQVVTQTKTVKGTIIDESGEPLIGVSIVVKGTSTGTITDFNGNFSIDLPAGRKELVISYIGYKEQTVTVTGNGPVNVKMVSDTQALDEVVVIGYGAVKKRDLTGAVASVKSEDITMNPGTNPMEALQGKVAGLDITRESGQAGSGVKMQLRGNRSLTASGNPMFIIDGMPGDYATLNPNDIESMQILKDASATAIYGARGANGVVLITTKRGKAGENKISYSGYLGTQKVDNPFEFLNAKDYMNLQNALYQEIDGQEGNPNGVYTPSQLQSTVDTDWLDVCTRLALVQDHNIQFRGGSEKTKVLTSLGYYKQEGVLKNTDFNRISGRVNVDQTINDFIKAGEIGRASCRERV